MTNEEAAPRGALGYAQIRDELRARLARGELQPGDRLPPVRELAAELGVNVNTVARAYNELARDGAVVTHAGGGTHVASHPAGELFQRARAARLQEIMGAAVLQALGLGYRPEQIEAAVLDQVGRLQPLESVPAGNAPPVDWNLLLAGSHDLTLDLLTARLLRHQPPIHLAVTATGSLAGLVALAQDQAHLAGCHLLDEETGDYNAPFVSRLLPGQPVVLVTLALRQQGLMVPPGNPRNIRSLADLARSNLVIALRQRGSGTQVLLEHELRKAGLSVSDLRRGDRTYATHLAVAGAIAAGLADAGLGILGAARTYGLDFISIATERYELAVPQRLAGDPAIRGLLDTLGSQDFQRTVNELGGYDLAQTGQQRLIS